MSSSDIVHLSKGQTMNNNNNSSLVDEFLMGIRQLMSFNVFAYSRRRPYWHSNTHVHNRSQKLCVNRRLYRIWMQCRRMLELVNAESTTIQAQNCFNMCEKKHRSQTIFGHWHPTVKHKWQMPDDLIQRNLFFFLSC